MSDSQATAQEPTAASAATIDRQTPEFVVVGTAPEGTAHALTDR
ncbi:hypothetical protein P3L51_17030 [Streptomyces sp. PSRA5]